MNHRPTPSRLAVASRRMQVRIKQENAASDSTSAAEPSTFAAAGSPINLDLLVATGRARLRVAIDSEAQRHSQEVARESAAIQARLHASLNRRNDRASLVLEHFNDEMFWRGLIPIRSITGDAP